MRLVSTLATMVLASVALPGVAQSQDASWTHGIGYPQWPFETEALALDLDGDGRDELASWLHQQPLSNDPRREDASGIGVLRFDATGTAATVEVQWKRRGFPMGAVAIRAAPQDLLVVGQQHPLTLDVYAGLPLRRLASHAVDTWIAPLTGGDANADGRPDLLEAIQGSKLLGKRYRLRDLASGTVLWTSMEFETWYLKAGLAQLDADPALEVAVQGPQGTVLDGATGLLEWSLAGGVDRLAVGRFDAAALPLAVVAGQQLSFYRGSPLAPAESVELADDVDVYDLEAANLDADPEDELLVRHDYQWSVFDRSTQALRRLPVGGGPGSLLTAAQLDQDAATELVVGIVDATSGSYNGFGVLDGLSETEQFHLARPPADALPFVVGELAGQGVEELLVLSAEPHLHAHVLGAQDGQLRRSRRLSTDIWSERRPGSMVAAPLDADPALEVVLHVTADGGGIVALDAQTLQLEWIGSAAPFVGLAQELVDATAADLDGDGDPELVTLLGPFEKRVRVQDGRSGALQWQSADLGRAFASALVTLQADADAALEVVSWTGQRLDIHDGATGQSQLSLPTPAEGTAEFVHLRHAGECRFALYTWAGRWHEYRCDGTPVREFAVDAGLSSLVAVGEDAAFGIRAGRLVRVDLATGRSRAYSDYLGPNAGADARLVVGALPDGRPLVLLANDGAVRAIDVVGSERFADGFE
jgi:hypothetical protein